MLNQVRTIACSRTQHVVGGKGEALVYITTNIDDDWTVSIGGLREAIFLSLSGPAQRSGSDHALKQALLHILLLVAGSYNLTCTLFPPCILSGQCGTSFSMEITCLVVNWTTGHIGDTAHSNNIVTYKKKDKLKETL